MFWSYLLGTYKYKLLYLATKWSILLLSEWVKSLSRVWLFVTPRTVAYWAPPSMGFSRQEYWSRLPFPSPGELPDPGLEPGSPALWADTLLSETPGSPIQSEISQKEKNKYCRLMTYMEFIYEWNLCMNRVFISYMKCIRGFSGCSDGKESTCKAGDPGLIPGLVRIREGNGYALQ